MPDRSRSLGRNDPCHCGSGKKYKQCCLAKDETKEREARTKASSAGTAEPVGEPAKATPPSRQATRQPWKRGAQNTKGFGKLNIPRRVGGS